MILRLQERALEGWFWQALKDAIWDAFVRYCNDGDLEIDNNGAERSLQQDHCGKEKTGIFMVATKEEKPPRF